MLFIGMSYTIGAELSKDKLPSYYDYTDHGEGTDDSGSDLAYNAPEMAEEMKLSKPEPKEVRVERTDIPGAFRGIEKNRIQGAEALDSTFMEIAEHDKTVRILQIGDSHVRGHVFPVTVRQTLEKAFGSQATEDSKVTYNTSCIAKETGEPGVVFSAIGINGARASRFTDDDMIAKIAEQQPDMVIISFGTNESIGNYSEEAHALSLDILMDKIKAACPGVTFLLTTPPGCYTSKCTRRYRDRRGRRRYSYTYAKNANTQRVADNIVKVAREKHAAVWDMYSIAGGDDYACLNWRGAGLMNRDQVHYTAAGYKLQGQWLGEAILDAYNDYIKR